MGWRRRMSLESEKDPWKQPWTAIFSFKETPQQITCLMAHGSWAPDISLSSVHPQTGSRRSLLIQHPLNISLIHLHSHVSSPLNTFFYSHFPNWFLNSLLSPSSRRPAMVVVGLGVGLGVGSSLPSGTAGWSPFFRSSLRPSPQPLTHVRHVGNLFRFSASSSSLHLRLPRPTPVLALDSDLPRPIRLVCLFNFFLFHFLGC